MKLAAGLVAGLACSAVQAVEVPLGDLTTVRFENLFTMGAAFRMQSRDPSLVGKSSLNPGICVERISGDFDDPDAEFRGDTCSATVDDPEFGDANQRFVAQPGSFGPNADNGNLNFDKGDVVNAAAKLTTDISFSIPFKGVDFNFFARTLMLFDGKIIDLDQSNPDTTFLPPKSALSSSVRTRSGAKSQILDGFMTTNLPFIGDRLLQVKVGRQVLNWGESAFLVPNSLNFVNALDQALLRVPGFDIAELFRPQGMVVLNTDIVQDVSLQLFYQYEWRPVVADPVGTFFSQSDIVGEGGTGALLAFGKAPEDPNQRSQPINNPDDPTAILGSTSSRTVLRDFEEENRREPRNGGQFGGALRWFFPGINNGVEVGLYYARVHNRFPVVSAFATDATCIDNPQGPIDGAVNTLTGQLAGLPGIGDLPTTAVTNLASLVVTCEIPLQNLAAAGGAGDFAAAGREALPLDSARLIVEYPEDRNVFGLSFNTALGVWAFSGEYAFRDQLPVQIHPTDLVFAALQPAFPAEDLELGIATLPGRRTAVPDFLSQFRGQEIEPNQYIRGFENLKAGQVNLNFIRFLGGSENPFRASQMTLLLEVGMQHIVDMPALDELQFVGGQADTHISNGADGTQGIQPPDVRDVPPGDPDEDDFSRRGRQNPTAVSDLDTFGSRFSWGYRAVALAQYNDAFLGINLSPLLALFHDVNGTSPGIGGNFVQGRRQVIAQLGFDYLSRIIGGVRYTWFTGGGKRDLQRDRDNLQFFVGYQF